MVVWILQDFLVKGLTNDFVHVLKRRGFVGTIVLRKFIRKNFLDELTDEVLWDSLMRIKVLVRASEPVLFVDAEIVCILLFLNLVHWGLILEFSHIGHLDAKLMIFWFVLAQVPNLCEFKSDSDFGVLVFPLYLLHGLHQFLICLSCDSVFVNGQWQNVRGGDR